MNESLTIGELAKSAGGMWRPFATTSAADCSESPRPFDGIRRYAAADVSRCASSNMRSRVALLWMRSRRYWD